MLLNIEQLHATNNNSRYVTFTYHPDEPVQDKGKGGEVSAVVKGRYLLTLPALVSLLKLLQFSRIKCSYRLIVQKHDQ